MSSNYFWANQFRDLFDQAVSNYKKGATEPGNILPGGGAEAIAEWGLRPIHIFDYVEDFVDCGDPSPETALLVAAARRDYFLYELGGVWPDFLVEPSSLPARTDSLGGLEWLPRILAKARCFLRGNLCKDIMYGCGGDRAFLKKIDLHPADFLRSVWASRDDDSKILAFLQR